MSYPMWTWDLALPSVTLSVGARLECDLGAKAGNTCLSRMLKEIHFS